MMIQGKSTDQKKTSTLVLPTCSYYRNYSTQVQNIVTRMKITWTKKNYELSVKSIHANSRVICRVWALISKGSGEEIIRVIGIWQETQWVARNL
jgi:hypothetical protein